MVPSRIPELINLSSVYTYKCYRDGALIWKKEKPNLVTHQGLEYAMGLIFGDIDITNPQFYVGLIGNGSAPVSEDTMNSHGFNEYTSYTKADRSIASWKPVEDEIATYKSADSQFFISKDETLYGAFLSTDIEKGGSDGYLYGASFLDGDPQELKAGDVLFVDVIVKAIG